VIRAVGARVVTADQLGSLSRLWGTAGLIHTGWSRHWGTARYLEFDNPFLSPDAVEQLIAATSPSWASTPSTSTTRPIHTAQAHHGLLGADIPIIEHLTNLKDVPDEDARLIALPAPISGMASFPVRAVAVLPE
jgi:arylformamidase